MAEQRAQVIQAVRKLAGRELRKPVESMSASLRQLGGTETTVARLAVKLEDQFSIHIRVKDLNTTMTMTQIVDMVMAKLTSKR